MPISQFLPGRRCCRWITGAPEHLFPAAHEDRERAFAWARANGPKGKAKADILSLADDSIGGGLAVSVCAEAIAAGAGADAPDTLVLFGSTLEANVIAERAERACDRLLSNAALGSLALYAGAAGTQDPRISSLRLPDDALAHFPPALIQAGAPEFLLYDSEAFARRLTAMNRRVTLSIWPDMPHIWRHFTDFLPEAKAALAEAGAFAARVN